MTKWAPLWRHFLLLLLAVFFTGCDPLSRSPMEDERDPHYIEGRNKFNAMDWDGAIESYEKAVQANPRNAAAHLALGSLYNEQKKDHAAAIYHYERHLRLRPDSPMAEVVKGHINGSKQELAKTVSYAVISRDAQLELDRYIRTNQILARRIENLELELNRRPAYVTNFVTNFVAVPQFSPSDRSSARMTQATEPVAQPAVLEPAPQPQIERERPADQSAAARPRPAASQRESTQRPRTEQSARQATPKPAARRTHTVRPGETLAVVARKYGISVASLKQANPDAARGARAGQKLVIPSR